VDRTKVAIAIAMGLVVAGVLVTRTPAPDAGGGKHLPIEMPWAEAEAYLGRLGYTGVRGDDKLLVARDAWCGTDAECRARKPKLVFHYRRPSDLAGPFCISVSHSYPLDWRKITQKLAGEDISSLPEPAVDYLQVIRTAAGPQKLRVSADATKLDLGTACPPPIVEPTR
jgi:hypothetical protein